MNLDHPDLNVGLEMMRWLKTTDRMETRRRDKRRISDMFGTACEALLQFHQRELAQRFLGLSKLRATISNGSKSVDTKVYVVDIRNL